jgi:hypothetical protein
MRDHDGLDEVITMPGMRTWNTFVKNHAHAVLAYDFFLVATATFRLCYVFVVLEIGTRRIVHWNVTGIRAARRRPNNFA